MVRKFTLFVSLLFVASLAVDLHFNSANSNGTGAPAGNTGSPADGASCGSSSSCHNNNNPTTNNDFFATNIPAAGYTPGATYTFIVSFSGIGNKGFQISPQKSNGQYVGTLVNTTTTGASGTKIVGSKYITHTLAQSAGSGSWTFNWTAPAAGTGAVTFYGAYISGRFNVHGKGSKTFQENLSASVADVQKNKMFTVFPNPVTDKLNISFSLESNQHLSVKVYDITGKEMLSLIDGVENGGEQLRSFDIHDRLNAGMYFVTMIKGDKRFTQKFIVR
jgi:hypothetical protein